MDGSVDGGRRRRRVCQRAQSSVTLLARLVRIPRVVGMVDRRVSPARAILSASPWARIKSVLPEPQGRTWCPGSKSPLVENLVENLSRAKRGPHDIFEPSSSNTARVARKHSMPRRWRPAEGRPSDSSLLQLLSALGSSSFKAEKPSAVRTEACSGRGLRASTIDEARAFACTDHPVTISCVRPRRGKSTNRIESFLREGSPQPVEASLPSIDSDCCEGVVGNSGVSRREERTLTSNSEDFRNPFSKTHRTFFPAMSIWFATSSSVSAPTLCSGG